MNLIKTTLHLFYKYYDKGSTKIVAYNSSVTALIMIIFINLFSLILLFGIDDKIPFYSTSRLINYLVIFLLFYLPLYFFISRKFKKEEIENVKLKNSLKTGYFLLVSYILISVIFLIFVINKSS